MSHKVASVFSVCVSDTPGFLKKFGKLPGRAEGEGVRSLLDIVKGWLYKVHNFFTQSF